MEIVFYIIIAAIVLAIGWIVLAVIKEGRPELPDWKRELDEKIELTKKHGSWDGVDVDEFMDMVRGREDRK